MKDYSKGLIYTIKTNDGLYVGSTCDFQDRKRQHKQGIYNENAKRYNLKLYKNIRENNGEYRIEIYKLFPCNDKRELEQEEDRVMIELNANLNMMRAYTTEERRKENVKKLNKEYRKENRDDLLKYQREYYKNTQQERLEYAKKYREENQNEINEKYKEYHKENKNEINEKKRERYNKNKDKINEKIKCECGCKINNRYISSHRKSKKHLDLMKQLDNIIIS